MSSSGYRRWISLCALAALSIGCEETTTHPSPTESKIEFEPAPGALELESCASQGFHATHRDGEALEVQYWLDDESVAESTDFVWDQLPPGEFVLRAQARADDGEASNASWTLNVSGPACDFGGGDIFFFPEAKEIEVEPFASVLFRASHREPVSFRVEYRLDGVAAAENRLFEWTAGLPGAHVVDAVVRKPDGNIEFAEWTVRVADRVSTPVPAVEAVLVERLEAVGEAKLTWRRAFRTRIQVPIFEYEIYASTKPIVRIDAPDVSMRVVQDDPTLRTQTTVLTGLAGGQTNYVRVVARDLMERRSEPSEEVDTHVTGLFGTTGRCLQFSPATQVWTPAPNLEVRWNQHQALTSLAGKYRLSDLSDYDTGRLWISDPRGRLAPMRSEEIDPTTPSQLFHALPMVEYSMDLGDGGSSRVVLPRLLRIFSRTDFNADHRAKPVYRWEQYPVPVHALPFVHVGNGGEVVEYAPLIENAVALWNAVARRPLLEVAQEPPASGVLVTVDLTPVSGLLGQTLITRPYRGDNFEQVPEEITIRLREFNTVDVARRIIVHEMGHALLLGHSPDPTHVMHSSASRANPTELEGMVATFLSRMPQGIDMNRYRD